MLSQFTVQDLQNLKKLVLPEIDGIVQRRLEPIDRKIDKVITILDKHTGILERHDQELKVLGLQQQKTTGILVKKGVAVPEELAVI